MERLRQGERNFRPTPKKPLTLEAAEALVGEMRTIAELGQKAMASDTGITLPSGRRATRILRNGNLR